MVVPRLSLLFALETVEKLPLGDGSREWMVVPFQTLVLVWLGLLPFVTANNVSFRSTLWCCHFSLSVINSVTLYLANCFCYCLGFFNYDCFIAARPGALTEAVYAASFAT